MTLLSKRLTKPFKSSTPHTLPSNEGEYTSQYSVIPQEEDGSSFTQRLKKSLGRKKSKVFVPPPPISYHEAVPDLPTSKTMYIVAPSESKSSFSSSTNTETSGFGFHSKMDQIWDSSSSLATSRHSSNEDFRRFKPEQHGPSAPMTLDFKASLQISPTSNSLSSICSDERISEDGSTHEDVELSQASKAFRFAVGLTNAKSEDSLEEGKVESSYHSRPTTPSNLRVLNPDVPERSPPFKEDWEAAASVGQAMEMELPKISFGEEESMAEEVLEQLERMSTNFEERTEVEVRESVYAGLGFNFPSVPLRAKAGEMTPPTRSSSIQGHRRCTRNFDAPIYRGFSPISPLLHSPLSLYPSTPIASVAINVVPPTPIAETPGSIYSVASPPAQPSFDSPGLFCGWDHLVDIDEGDMGNEEKRWSYASHSSLPYENEYEQGGYVGGLGIQDDPSEADLSLATVLEEDYRGSSLEAIGVAM